MNQQVKVAADKSPTPPLITRHLRLPLLLGCRKERPIQDIDVSCTLEPITLIVMLFRVQFYTRAS